MGAPKATPMPAAVAAESSSRFLDSLKAYLENKRDTTFETQHDTWIAGPSLPMLSRSLFGVSRSLFGVYVVYCC